jgi:primosomal protein N' (replication factor Y)
VADTWDEGAAGLLLTDYRPAEEVAPPGDARADKKKKPAKSKKPKDPRTLLPAASQPVARIAVDTPLAHLDRPFDYLVPQRLADQARPGVRVRVRFAGVLTDGFVIERADESEHQGSLRYLERVISAEPVLTEEIAGLARAVADRYAGTLADVLRLAVPQRHAATEAAVTKAAARATVPAKATVPPSGTVPPTATVPPSGARPDPGPWARYPAGQSFLDALAAGRPARAAWQALPGPAWPDEIARAALTTASTGRGAVIVVPDVRDLARVDAALAALGARTTEDSASEGSASEGSASEGSASEGRATGDRAAAYVTLTADLGPAERYRRWLAALLGQARIVVGTRAAMFAPVRDLGLVVLWDDGDDLHAEPRAP